MSHLKLIQGGSTKLETSRSEAKLTLVVNQTETIRCQRRAIQNEMRTYWRLISEQLTLKQFSACMDSVSYWDKCQKVRQMSRNKTVLEMVSQLEALCVELHRLPA